jgi:mannobiose 2-epimerase
MAAMTGENQKKLVALKTAVESDLLNGILPFWTDERLVDNEFGGFYGRVTRDDSLVKDADKALVLNGRMLWTFCNAYRLYGGALYEVRAKRAYEYLVDRFFDREFGGAYNMLDHKGAPTGGNKVLYGISFFVYSLAAYYQAFGDPEAFYRAKETVLLIEKHMKQGDGLYWDVMDREWKTPFSRAPVDESYTFTAQLHLFEAYELLFRVSKDPEVGDALLGFLRCITAGPLFDHVNRCFQCNFTKEYKRVGARQSFGHDCELMYLSDGAAELFDDKALRDTVRKNAVLACETVLANGFDRFGGLNDGFDLTTRSAITEKRDWWTQAEGVSAMLFGFQATHDPKFLDAAVSHWEYVDKYFVDRVYGDWNNFIVVNPDTQKGEAVEGYHGFDKVGPGKCPYHNSRMCFEVVRRVDEMLNVKK